MDLKPLKEDLHVSTLPVCNRIEDMNTYPFAEAEEKYDLVITGWMPLDDEPHVYASFTNWAGHGTGDYCLLYSLEGRPYFILEYGDENDAKELRVVVYLDGMIDP